MRRTAGGGDHAYHAMAFPAASVHNDFGIRRQSRRVHRRRRSRIDPGQLTVGIGDTVEFYGYTDVMATRHNVVADDGSFRCALGCDGEGGDGHPAVNMYFVRKFNSAGVVRYHDEVSRATGVIFVADASPFAISARASAELVGTTRRRAGTACSHRSSFRQPVLRKLAGIEPGRHGTAWTSPA